LDANPKDTKTFWIQKYENLSKRYKNLLDANPKGKRYENLSDAEDTKTQKIRLSVYPARSTTPPTTDDGSRRRSHRITTYCAWSNCNAPSELEKEDLFGSIPD
jgi:hypothetical protein